MFALGLTEFASILVGLLILWLIISIPVYVSGWVVTGGNTSIGRAMLATLLGPIVYFVVLLITGVALGAFIGGSAFVIAIAIAFIALLSVYKSIFRTGWLGAFAIAVVSIIIFTILVLFMGFFISTTFPGIAFPDPVQYMQA